ncbi:hypothetical protein NM208_g7098 [Fusarium decemcellulare]|uniref:Uncharacterized protein n=1 Tax=Fusarium decemcellulare TaxID=57161 RepID=A0ACC1SAF3_9HYPO|nr:hypothetical protein NM208_g7098 [Fusarium decemcellulare]
MAKRNLLLCFDAFGTLFKPARPVAQQYAEVARQCGITNFKDGDVHSSLLSAMKEESKQNPNYGKATGLGATKWWTNIIHNTFNPLIEPNQSLPKDLAPKLLHRILASFGLNVSPLRYGTAADPKDFAAGQEYDIDFHCMSYDVGIEKPDRLIFHAADLMLAHLISIRNGKSPSDAQAEIENWRKVYVGDEHAKDVVGAVNAGWDPVLLDEEDQSPDIPRLEDHPTETLDSLYKKHQAVRVRSLENLVKWFTADDPASTA